MSNDHFKLAEDLAKIFASRPEIRAVALGGSAASSAAEPDSDIDLYVFCDPIVPLAFRQTIVKGNRIQDAELNLQFWDTGDAWHDPETGIEVDIMYWDPVWIEDRLDRVLIHHQASLGYSTCFWYTIHQSQVLYDLSAWFSELKEKANQPYPESLRNNIIEKNHAVLRNVIPAYTHQIQKALDRGDLVSLNHRVAGLMASYFDIIFAYNWQLHPGEKRLVKQALARCPYIPENMMEDIRRVLRWTAEQDTNLLSAIHSLIDSLDKMLEKDSDHE